MKKNQTYKLTKTLISEMKEKTLDKTPPEDFPRKVFHIYLRSEKPANSKAFEWFQNIEKLQK